MAENRTPLEEDPTDIDVIIAKSYSGGKNTWTKFFHYLCVQYFNEYDSIQNKFDKRKTEICQEIIDALFPGRFVQKNKKEGQWYELSNAKALEQVKQRFCHIRRNVKEGHAPSIDENFTRSSQIRDY